MPGTGAMKTLARHLFAIVLLVILSGAVVGQPTRVVYEGSDALPPVKIAGHAANIHTQGLFVTEHQYYVTGRLETKPKRALLLRFNRSDLKTYEYIDITPASPEDETAVLDHAGGFDLVDDKYFLIPIARSNPQGPTLVVRVNFSPRNPLAQCESEIVFKVDDHIGAICYEPTTRRLYGANWDTKIIYAWDITGQAEQQFARSQWVAENPQWQLAVQDWKSAGGRFAQVPGTIIAGGIDKSPDRAAEASSAVIDFLDPGRRRQLARIHMPAIEGVTRPVTNEGLAWYQQHLFLLPEDIGRGAKVLRFRIHDER